MMNPEGLPIAWTIAGSDSGGGAGIQADLLTFADFAVHGCSVVTALTAQNSFALGYCLATERKSVVAQINALDSDLPAAAIKLGMLANSEIIETVARYLEDYQGPVICDPVMATTTGGSLLEEAGGQVLRERLLPRADLITPNVPEAELLTGLTIADNEDMVAAARALLAAGARSVLITGGHLPLTGGKRLDYWTDGEQSFWLAGENIDTIHTHGSGCTLSSAIAALIARGFTLQEAIVTARAYVTRGIRAARQIGSGPGPVAHRGWPGQLEDWPQLHRQPLFEAPVFPRCPAPLGLYPVVDSVEWVERMLVLGVKTVQLRIKNVPEQALSEAIRQAVALQQQYQAQLFINDHWQLAITHGAFGVHLGQEDLDSADLAAIARAGLRLGVSTHSEFEIVRAHSLRPSYIALGPIYATASKPMAFSPRGLERLQRWVDLLGEHYPLTAIGGINPERAPEVLATGVGSCAMITAITEAEDYVATVKQLLALHR